MRKIFSQMWNDDAGIVALEYLLVATIVGLGLVVGLTAVSEAINAEFVELANAILALDQGYATSTQSTCGAYKAGTTATDVQGVITYGHSTVSPQGTTGSVSVAVCP